MMSRLFLFFVLAAPTASAQDLLFSLSTDIASAPAPYTRDEIHRLRPGGGVAPFIPTETWRVIVGDRNANGRYDDAPTNIDALHVRPGGGGLPTWLFSTTTSISISGSGSAKDGDMLAFDASGGMTIVHSESTFAAATATATIDVDAFAEGPTGQLWFSFAEDEATTSAALTAANGGTALLDEQTVFRLDPGAPEAVIAFTKAQVVAAFNQAVGSNATSVVDVTGLAPDPASPGDLLLCVGSASSSFRGKVITTAGGGTLWTTSAGHPADPASFGLSISPALDALSITVEAPHPVLRATPLQGSSSAGGLARCEVADLPPGTLAQLIVSGPRMPGPFAWQSPGIGGFVALYPDPMDPVTWLSLNVPAWQLMANANGIADYQWNWNSLPPGTAVLGQVFVPGTGAVSSPAVVNVLP